MTAWRCAHDPACAEIGDRCEKPEPGDSDSPCAAVSLSSGELLWRIQQAVDQAEKGGHPALEGLTDAYGIVWNMTERDHRLDLTPEQVRELRDNHHVPRSGEDQPGDVAIRTLEYEAGVREQELTDLRAEAAAMREVLEDSACSHAYAFEGQALVDRMRKRYEGRPQDVSAGDHLAAIERVLTGTAGKDLLDELRKLRRSEAARPAHEAAHQQKADDAVSMTVHGITVRVVNSADCNRFEEILAADREKARHEGWLAAMRHVQQYGQAKPRTAEDRPNHFERIIDSYRPAPQSKLVVAAKDLLDALSDSGDDANEEVSEAADALRDAMWPRRENASTGVEHHAKRRAPTPDEAKAIAEGQAKLRASHNASAPPERCQDCIWESVDCGEQRIRVHTYKPGCLLRATPVVIGVDMGYPGADRTVVHEAPSSSIPGLKIERYGHIRGIGEERITFKVEVPASHAARALAAIEALALVKP